ncbi:MAG: hypothetical protein R3276_07465 [Marinobacter sp.]|nr:hypothetical protein [Marinobacter sp.]
MISNKHSLLALAIASVGLSGCLDSGGRTGKNSNPDYDVEFPAIQEGTSPVFSPLDTAFPIPSDALFFLSEVDDGTMLDGTDPANPVTTGIGYMDGNSILAPVDIKIEASLDPNQTFDAREFVEVDGEVIPNPDQNVFFIELEYPSGDSLKQADGEVAGIRSANRYRQALALREAGDDAGADAILADLLEPKFRVELLDIDGGQDNLLRIAPITPLTPKARYAVAISNAIVDGQGEPLVGSVTYQSVSNPERILSNPALQPFRDAMVPARTLTAEYFDFKRDILGNAATGKTFADIPMATTVTMTAVDDVLLANAAPATFFERSLLIDAKQTALGLLQNGSYNLTEQPVAGQADQAVNDEIFRLLTDETFRLYDSALASLLTDARDQGLTLSYADLVNDPDDDRKLAFTLQTATATAVENIQDQSADADTLAAEADTVLDTPKPRDVRFFSQKEGGEVNPALQQTAVDLGITEVNVNVQVFEGEITLPYYQSLPVDGDGTPIQSGNWTAADFSASETLAPALSDRVTYRFPFASKVTDTKVPIVVATPDEDFGAPPATGYPVIIYQHAATTDRSATLPMATAAALLCLTDDSTPNNDDTCFVTVAIDQPLHGIFDSGLVGLSPITEQAGASGDAVERHFGFAADADLAAVPASQLTAPESGSLFLNFANYANTRDNLRQGALDLLNVNASLQAIEDGINACVTAGDCTNGINLDLNRVYFLSHSLSGMGGVAFPHVNNAAIAAGNSNLNSIQAANFLNTGGHFSRLIENSPAVAPRLLPGLDVASDGLLAQGRTELNIYFNVFQALLDSADPSAFAPYYQDNGIPTLLTSIVGVEGDPDRPTDSTVPNAADDLLYDLGPLEFVDPETGFTIDSERAPLAGTDPMAAAMGAESTPLASSLPVITRYLEGSHGNPISAGQKASDAFSSSAVFNEMAFQLRSLFNSGTVTVDNPCVVQDADQSATDCSDSGGNTDAGADGGDGGDSGSDGGDGGDDGGLLGGIL